MAAGTGTNGWAGLIPAAIAAALFGAFAAMIPAVAAGGALRWSMDWVPSLGIEIAFSVDGLSLTFALLISGIGALVMAYANDYLAGHPQWSRFALFLTAFMLSMLGLVLADDLLTLFVFWEGTTITSYLLIGFGHETAKGRRSALQALFVTGAGALALLAGLILLGQVAGTYRISEILTMGPRITSDPMYLGVLILILAGAFTKSAQVPFHFWLPNAMAAPTPVSAFLHSATMVKAGVYLMARMHPALSGTAVWLWTLTIFGAVTAVFASVAALRQTDLKQALAYTTLMALGTLTLLLGQEGAYAMTAFATFLVVHSLYKAALFLVVGNIDHEAGTREVAVLGGLARAMPATALAAVLAALSMAGIPPFVGFIAKELAYAGAVESAASAVLVAGASLAANALMVAVALIVAFKPFFRPPGGPLPNAPHEASVAMVLGPIVLAILGSVLGVVPALLQGSLIDATVAAVSGGDVAARELKLWAGVNLPLVLSIATFALGVAIYAAKAPARRGLDAAFDAGFSWDAAWDRFLDGLKGGAGWQTRIVQPGVLRHYLWATFAVVAVALGATLALRGGLPGWPQVTDVTWKNWALVLLILAGTGLVAVTRSRIAAVAALGVVGIGVAMIFIVHGAPDVAITQLLVETLVVVLVAVAMLRLPFLDAPGTSDVRPLDAALALAVGAVVTVILLRVLEAPLDLELTAYFNATSWPEAFGRNVVNVILVDFRALDTFGEIAVVVVAGLAAYALLRTTRPDKRVEPSGERIDDRLSVRSEARRP
ncbi:MAG: putative monovalent cation/H+ antiporter subunit A [Paracoccaceae bacterium]